MRAGMRSLSFDRPPGMIRVNRGGTVEMKEKERVDRNLEKPVLVTGATGYIGGRLVPRLLELGYRVRAMGRSMEKLDGRPWSFHPAWNWSGGMFSMKGRSWRRRKGAGPPTTWFTP